MNGFYITWYSRAIHFAREIMYCPKSDAEKHRSRRVPAFIRTLRPVGCIHQPYSYLFTSIKNKCLDYLRKRVNEQEAVAEMQSEFDMTLRMKYDSLEILNTNFPDETDIEERLEQALQKLPERCRSIFVMNKLEGKKQQQIASELQISINTVESQMAIAYKKLREEVKKTACLYFFFLFTLP